MKTLEKIILASKSPRRRELLHVAEIDFEVLVTDADESFDEGLAPDKVAEHIAVVKARAAAVAAPERVILAADTIVVCDGRIIGKPASRSEAIETLQFLSGKTHDVITGVCIIDKEKQTVFSDRTAVSFYALTTEQITFYVDKYQPYDKAGAYAIQEWIGVAGIKKIEGDFYNVMGLPVARVLQVLSGTT